MKEEKDHWYCYIVCRIYINYKVINDLIATDSPYKLCTCQVLGDHFPHDITFYNRYGIDSLCWRFVLTWHIFENETHIQNIVYTQNIHTQRGVFFIEGKVVLFQSRIHLLWFAFKIIKDLHLRPDIQSVSPLGYVKVLVDR